MSKVVCAPDELLPWLQDFWLLSRSETECAKRVAWARSTVESFAPEGKHEAMLAMQIALLQQLSVQATAAALAWTVPRGSRSRATRDAMAAMRQMFEMTERYARYVPKCSEGRIPDAALAVPMSAPRRAPTGDAAAASAEALPTRVDPAADPVAEAPAEPEEDRKTVVRESIAHDWSDGPVGPEKGPLRRPKTQKRGSFSDTPGLTLSDVPGVGPPRPRAPLLEPLPNDFFLDDLPRGGPPRPPASDRPPLPDDDGEAIRMVLSTPGDGAGRRR